MSIRISDQPQDVPSGAQLSPAMPAPAPGPADTQREDPASRPAYCISRENILRRLGGNLNLLKNLAEMFPDEAVKAFAALKEARMAQKAAEVQRTAHNLKGIFGMFEISTATAAAFDLEKTATAGGLGTDLQMNTLSDELDRAVQAVKDFQKTLNE